MKALVKSSPEPGLDMVERPEPAPGPNDLLVRIKASAICGSDLKIYQWDPFMKQVIRTLPVIPGHECAGEVVEVGSEVDRFRAGDRVAAETHVPCGSCWQCIHDRRHTCENMQLFGHTIDGCFAEYALIPQSAAWKLPEGFPFESGCLLEPMGIPYRAVERASLSQEPVVVLGCGPIGQFALAFARLRGARPLIAVDINPLRLDIAREMGADHCLNPQQIPITETIQEITRSCGKVSVIIEASGKVKALEEILPTLRLGGKLMVLGQTQDVLALRVSPDIVLRELEIAGFYGRLLWDTWEKTQEILVSGRVDIQPVITHRYPLEEYQTAFTQAASGHGCKVLLLS